MFARSGARGAPGTAARASTTRGASRQAVSSETSTSSRPATGLATRSTPHTERSTATRQAQSNTSPARRRGRQRSGSYQRRRNSPMSPKENQGHVAVITGASSGIGEATARVLAADGYRLALLARRADRIQKLAQELGDSAVAITADVTDRDSLVAAAASVEEQLGGADVLINNAGVMLLAPFSSEQKDEIRKMVETNLLGAMTATEVFLDQPRTGAVTSSTSPRWPAAPPAPAMRSTPPPSGGWAAGRRRCAKSCSRRSAWC